MLGTPSANTLVLRPARMLKCATSHIDHFGAETNCLLLKYSTDGLDCALGSSQYNRPIVGRNRVVQATQDNIK